MNMNFREAVLVLTAIMCAGHHAPAQSSDSPAAADSAVQGDSTAGSLDDLAWLVGDWVDQDEVASITFSVHWTKNGAFLVRSFRVTPSEGDIKAGMQLIAWDPAEQTIRSWTYDADGGFGEERWQHAGDRWTIRTKYTLSDGTKATATNFMRRIDDDSFTWRSVNRVIGGELQPDIDELVVIRETAQPASEPADGEARPANPKSEGPSESSSPKTSKQESQP